MDRPTLDEGGTMQVLLRSWMEQEQGLYSHRYSGGSLGVEFPGPPVFCGPEEDVLLGP